MTAALPIHLRPTDKRLPDSVVSMTRRLLVSDLCLLMESYLQADEVREVYRAYLFSAEAHEGQKRLSGEPYVFHPLAVAYLLAEMRMDAQTLCAAILHDVIEDTGIEKSILNQEFGSEVAEIVDGVSKLSQIQFATREQAQAASFRKMLLAMNRDIRVIIVKLADRLHNMRTLGAMKPTSQRRIAQETLEIYAPIASRLGINRLRIELEELSFAVLFPLRYRILTARVQAFYERYSNDFNMIKTSIERQLKTCGITATVTVRQRHVYGIYCKMQERKTTTERKNTFSKVIRTFPLRITVDTIDTCYRVLGIVHNLYKPKSTSFTDYIAIPKVNGYQSLHTALMSPYGSLIEIHIRTTAMHELAESGITARGLYRFDGSKVEQKASEWLQDLINRPGVLEEEDSIEFLQQIKMELSPDEVYVFTPKGVILQLPKGATAIDFAYAMDSQIGQQCIAAKVNQEYVPLSTPLASGQMVEVVTANWARPNPHWLDFVVTARARSHISYFLKKLTFDDAVVLGRHLLDKELGRFHLSLEQLTTEQTNQIIQTFKVTQIEQILAEIGLGERMALVVARLFTADLPREPVDSKPLLIKGTEGVLVSLARCCRPIPYDEIVGFFSVGKGITIHVVSCPNVSEYRSQPEKCLAVEWEKEVVGDFLVDIRIDVHNQRGVLAEIATVFARMESNIEHIAHEYRDGFSSTFRFCVAVKQRQHLAAILRQLRRLSSVTRVRRG